MLQDGKFTQEIWDHDLKGMERSATVTPVGKGPRTSGKSLATLSTGCYLH